MKRRMKRYYAKRIKAFTYIESILAMMILMIVLSMTPFLIQTLKATEKHTLTYHHVEFELFARGLMQTFENIKKDDVKTTPFSIELKDGSKVTYVHSAGKFYKTYPHRGNVILLYHVKQFECTWLNHKILKLKFVIEEGDTHIEKELYV